MSRSPKIYVKACINGARTQIVVIRGTDIKRR